MSIGESVWPGSPVKGWLIIIGTVIIYYYALREPVKAYRRAKHEKKLRGEDDDE